MQSKEKLNVENGTDVTIVTFEEENILEDQQIRKLERALLPVIRDNQQKKLVLNFIKVKFMSSAFLGLLVKVHKRVIEAGGSLQLYNLDPKIQKVFEITQLVKIFDIVRSEEGRRLSVGRSQGGYAGWWITRSPAGSCNSGGISGRSPRASKLRSPRRFLDTF